MMSSYSSKLGEYLKANNLPDKAHCDTAGAYTLQGWDEKADGPAPTEAEVEAWDPNPVTDVDSMAGLFAQAQAGAPAYLNQLKGAVWVALVAGGMSEADATAAGVALVLRHAAPLAAFEAAGGHPVAAAALYDAIASAESVKGLPWLTAPILAIFQSALKPG